jgi:hypothetical protein
VDQARDAMQRKQLDQLQRDGDRLIASWRALLAAMPEDAQGISALSRFLNLPKGTCQRVVEGAYSSKDGLHAYARFPGPEALRTVAEACARAMAADAKVIAESDGALGATAKFASNLEEMGLSQRGLIDAIARARANDAGSAVREDRARTERRALFTAASNVTGEHLDAKIAVGAYVPSAKAGRMHVRVALAFRGIRREPGARPVVPFIYAGYWEHPAPPIRKAPPGTPSGPDWEVIESLSTAGLRAERIAGEQDRTLLVVDTEHVAASKPSKHGVDIAMQFTSDAPLDPRGGAFARLVPSVRIMQPTRLLVHDMYIHKSLLAARRPRAACLSLSAPAGDGPGGSYQECWYERFPDKVSVAKIGRKSADLDSFADVVQVLADHALEGVNPTDMVAFRCFVAYPLWQSEYRVYFE